MRTLNSLWSPTRRLLKRNQELGARQEAGVKAASQEPRLQRPSCLELSLHEEVQASLCGWPNDLSVPEGTLGCRVVTYDSPRLELRQPSAWQLASTSGFPCSFPEPECQLSHGFFSPPSPPPTTEDREHRGWAGLCPSRANRINWWIFI